MSSIPPQPVLHLFADQGKVAQVVRNLLSNALKFTNRNGTIRINLYVEEDHAAAAAAGSVAAGGVADASNKQASSGAWASYFFFFSGFLLRSPKTYSESFPVQAKTLIIEVVDSGVGISLVLGVC